MNNILKVSSIILGSIVGAGFISGQEIYIFFNKTGSYGIVGLIIAIGIIGYIINKACVIIYQKQIGNYKEFIAETINVKNKIIKESINKIVTGFMLVSYFVMCTALNTYFYQEWNIPIFIIGSINCILNLYILNGKNGAVIKINELLMPIIFVAISFLGLKEVDAIQLPTIRSEDKIIQPIINGIIYASYNLILLIPILTSLRKFLENGEKIKIISIISTLIIASIAIIVYLIIDSCLGASNVEMPIIYIANTLGNSYHYLYGIVVIIAIFTTAISVGYGFLQNVRKKSIGSIALITISSIFISYIGFSNLISFLYPICGILGLIQIIFIIKY